MKELITLTKYTIDEEDEIIETNEVSFDYQGDMKTLTEKFRNFAKSLDFLDATVDKFLVDTFEYPDGLEDLNVWTFKNEFTPIVNNSVTINGEPDIDEIVAELSKLQKKSPRL